MGKDVRKKNSQCLFFEEQCGSDLVNIKMYTDPNRTLTCKVGDVYEDVCCSASGKDENF